MLTRSYKHFIRAGFSTSEAKSNMASEVEIDVETNDGPLRLVASPYMLAELIVHLTDLQTMVQLQSSQAGMGAPVMSIPVDAVQAEGTRKKRVLASLRPVQGPIASFDMSPQLARTFADELLKAAEDADKRDEGSTH